MNVITTQKAPAAVGPYSQAVRAGQFVFLSGQIPLAPETGALVAGGVTEQTEQIFANLKAVCEAAGGSLSRVVKCTVFMTDLAHFQAMNDVYAKHFREHKPARSTVQVAALPKGASVEIEATLFLE